MICLKERHPEEPAEFKAMQPKDPSQLERWEELQSARQKLSDLPGQPRKPQREHFDDNLWRSYKAEFREAQYGGKCAYCEDRIAGSQAGDVEHFRPKATCRSLVITAIAMTPRGHPREKWDPRAILAIGG